jgi:hypothetical protein
MGRYVVKLYALRFLFLIFIFTIDRIALSSTVNLASRADHELKSDGMFVRISSHCIPYSHLLTRIRYQRCMRLLTRSYRHTRVTAATTAATTPAH